jgi:hypothetical protein
MGGTKARGSEWAARARGQHQCQHQCQQLDWDDAGGMAASEV